MLRRRSWARTATVFHHQAMVSSAGRSMRRDEMGRFGTVRKDVSVAPATPECGAQTEPAVAACRGVAGAVNKKRASRLPGSVTVAQEILAFDIFSNTRQIPLKSRQI